eukprot:CAMPEP_0182479652 /NCGR_PEP_ID=MMETSP1319-20130603/34542_1 /TAXON_ID=172717 /ORGANISM="Bolidomonas pacifica, Strain RCC208" /LENGTH=42 /DNA_ID= /DNA_START= /DNA_END= /DNA_ORIENTATION=
MNFDGKSDTIQMMDNPIARTSEMTTVAKRRSKQTSGRDLEVG